MSLLAALTRAYDRLAERHEVPAFGYSTQNIGFLISLTDDGALAGPPIDLRQGAGKKRVGRPMAVPLPVKRTSGIAPNFLWDKTSYVLGVSAGAGKRLAEEHAAFVTSHQSALVGSEDPGLRALLTFLQAWTPDHFDTLGWPEEMKDQNVIFALESERLRDVYLHDREAARSLWARQLAATDRPRAVCLVSGEKAPIARLHPAIKGVWGGQSSGVSLISYNKESFDSYGHEQGDNAPVSEVVASAYTAVLNQFLASDSGHRIQIGDASTVFWADASDAETASLAENSFLAMIDSIDEDKQAGEVGAILEKMRTGMALSDAAPRLAEGVRFYVLGLAPNAARVSVRFWFEDDFGVLAKNYQRYAEETRIEPSLRDAYPPLWKVLLETAVLGKRENVPPNLAGAYLRAILTGTRYPQTLLSTLLMRLRSDKTVSPLRVALLRALLIRNLACKEAPVALDPENTNKGYLLGRLFAVYEDIQRAALGYHVNATIKDKFYGSASAQPRRIFKILANGAANHLSKIGKDKPGLKNTLEGAITAITEVLSPGEDPFPVAFSTEQQALFGLGYYHQYADISRRRAEAIQRAKEKKAKEKAAASAAENASATEETAQ
ncbi:type I-C CRISPR-associated protein Cas8c/Csd1 [Rhodospirillum rubrum]|uniref:CRISPR-associated protein, Csd1 family n=1 Tax=Rhodospirillum rubrum (strain ATCC 11170 / ATH 1.1.1 / DSM 467 / LMG 4362 / NCIMB 8255 / S1) TaxID=269796 RepID=Q2RW64_RHORT|nr:type I-C CRISPR-associated protein Cas8c/Csd1 [Rhodospirillum rubrum]ABC21631.1 CRISPR-associated protein, Csd1 family [Rhodospirillum rubrum ATCC 11170]AEO47326.1 CRISPR-associated RAMP Csd1 family protein [Rhodospirillum rubrum F11]QXG81299.1 type I-C CRISPR-associated protein Cas8c/Csd1 [Rhodospirillum rubrum]HAQ00923.1 type I-C CRISPR-associated protein Cas8c/Csd1 [Rhodospirillum rubrum]HCF17352.1 type I-C CRISPR-associated protein Cas8c/Csd1 [Rhodospirillum rubrum]